MSDIFPMFNVSFCNLVGFCCYSLAVSGCLSLLSCLMLTTSIFFNGVFDIRKEIKYLAFSGQKFAMLEMKLLMAEILRNFELQPVTRPEDLKFVADLVLRNKSGVYVTFAKRNNTRL